MVRVAARLGVAIMPRGGGTGLAGGAVPTEGGIVLNMTRINRIPEIDTAGYDLTQLFTGSGVRLGLSPTPNAQ